MIANVKSSPTLIPAIYKHGVFAPVAPIPGLFDDQFVQLQIWPGMEKEDMDDAEWVEEPKEDEEWAALTPWEQQGRRPVLSLDNEAEAALWAPAQWASFALPSDLAVEIATADWLAEENLWL